MIRAYVDLPFWKICGKFLGKVTRENQIRGKKKHLSINKLSLDSFSFKFHHLCLCFGALLRLILRKIREENKHGQH